MQNSSKLDEPSGETPPLSLPPPALEFSPTGGPVVVVVDWVEVVVVVDGLVELVVVDHEVVVEVDEEVVELVGAVTVIVEGCSPSGPPHAVRAAAAARVANAVSARRSLTRAEAGAVRSTGSR